MVCRDPSFRSAPTALLRFFDERRYSDSFIRGEVRLGLLEGYRSFEDARRDEMEGNVYIRWDLGSAVHCDRSSMNPRYILCTSHPDTDRSYLVDRFGKYIVRISDPVALRERIETVWQKHPLASGRSVLVPAVYNKGDLLPPTPGLTPPVEYSYNQKSKSFEAEREFRYVLTCTADTIRLKNFGALQSHITLKLPDCSDICSLT